MNLTDNIKFYNRDCMEAMAEMEDNAFDLAIVDPPYGIGRSGKRKSTSSHGGHKGYNDNGWDKNPPSPGYFMELFRTSKNQIIWGANYYPQYLGPSSGWILWDKGQRIDQGDGELAFSTINKPIRVFTLNRVAIKTDGAIHPTQKPVALYKWLLTNYAKPGDKILDTHGGSLSIAIACHDLGFDLTAYELDADYYQAACERVKKHVAQGQLFSPSQTFQPKQMTIE